MSEIVPTGLRTLVENRAQGRCEYCLLHQDNAALAHEPDHVISVKHRGLTEEHNLAWACCLCNRFKGTDLASLDPKSGIDSWKKHFRLFEGQILPRTSVGRVTAFILKFNLPKRVATRTLLSMVGDYPGQAE